MSCDECVYCVIYMPCQVNSPVLSQSKFIVSLVWYKINFAQTTNENEIKKLQEIKVIFFPMCLLYHKYLTNVLNEKETK